MLEMFKLWRVALEAASRSRYHSVTTTTNMDPPSQALAQRLPEGVRDTFAARSEYSNVRFSLASAALHMHGATPYPAWGSIQASSPSLEYSEKAATSARDISTPQRPAGM